MAQLCCTTQLNYAFSMPTSPGPLIEALEDLWSSLRTEILDLPTARIGVSPAPPTSNHGPERWVWESKGMLTGVVVSADYLRKGPEATAEFVLHEAAHALCWIREIDDTTSRGVYHNSSYLTAAEELGLAWPEHEPRTQGKGYATPRMPTSTQAHLAAEVAAIAVAIPIVLPHLTSPASSRSRQPARLVMECSCPDPRKMWMSRTVAERAPVVCSACGQEFRAV